MKPYHNPLLLIVGDHIFVDSEVDSSSFLSDGTSIATYQLASRLSQTSELQVLYVTASSQQIYDCDFKPVGNTLLDLIKNHHTIICPAIYQWSISSYASKGSVLVWIHHPFWRYFLPDEVIRAYVYCGKQVSGLRPLLLPNEKVFYANNILASMPNTEKSSESSESSYDIVFLGALYKIKGILVLLKDLTILSRSINLRIAIIGSVSMYGALTQHDDPYSHFEQNIRLKSRQLVARIENNGSKVDILGKIDAHRFTIIRNSKILVVNPTGSSEALSTSILEGFQLGTITLSGRRNGSRELLNKAGSYSYHNLIFWLLYASHQDKLAQLAYQYAIIKQFSDSSSALSTWFNLIYSPSCNSSNVGALPEPLSILEKLKRLKPPIRIV